jgi:type I restriction enzyme S subunit
MKKGWQRKQLGVLCDILDSQRKPITKRDRKAGKYPYYGATGIVDYVHDFIFDEPLVLVGEDGAKWESGENTAFAVEGKIWVNNHAHVLRPHRAKLIDNWLVYHLNHSDLTEFVSGLTVPKLNQGNLREIPVPLPPLPEQHRIVGILDEAFEGIATAKANAEKNLQNARALFASHLQNVFSQRGKGWVEKPLGDVCEVKDGTHDSPKYVADGIPFVTQKNIREEGLSFAKTKFISEEDHEDFYRRSNVAHGDILISMIGANRGMACVVDDDRTFSIKNVGLVKQNEAINQQFLLYFLKSPQAAGYVQAATKGGAQEFVGLTELRKFPVPVPPLKCQKTLADTFQALREETQRLESIYQRKLAALDELKKSLLDQAFSGEL